MVVLREETDGLVNAALPSPMLQPYEVWDQALFDKEMVRVFSRAWIWLGDTEDLVDPGDFITGTIGYQPVIVIRQPDGTLKGFLNNCRHRASGLLFEPSGNCGSSITCPYHNWAYSIDGRLVGIPDRKRMYPDGIPDDEYGLVEFRVEVAWDKFVFGCLSYKTEPFREYIEPLVARYDQYGFGEFKRYHRELNETYPINWKAFVENSNDDYHVRFVHSRLNDQLKSMDTIVRFAGRTCSGYKPRRQDVSGGRTDLNEEELTGGYADFIYPTLTPLPQPTMVMMVRADPIAPDRTRLFSRIYGLEESREVQDSHLDSLAETNREDTDMVTVLMENLRSPFYRVGPPSVWEGRAGHMMQLIRADVASPLADDEFAPTAAS